jgi:hypothetical protein
MTNNSCIYAEAMKANPSRNVFLILGLGTFTAFIFILIYFIGERTGIFPVLSVITLPYLSEGENWILFLILVFLLFTLGIFLIAIIGYHGFKYQCKKKSNIS